MNCEFAKGELVECARGGVALGAARDSALQAHLTSCRPCRERWEAERDLTAHLRAMRLASVPESLEWSKAVLLRDFDAHHRRERQVRWMWAMSAAAILVLSVVTLRDVRLVPAPVSQMSTHSQVTGRSFVVREYPQEAFAPAEAAGERGFIKVPFAMDPAPGETFDIVRTQLDPAELTKMGVSVEPGWTGTMQADVLVGQDGFPQAVRLSNDDIQRN